MTQEAVLLISELAGEQCRCGKGKVPYKTFCVRCFGALPAATGHNLYRRVGHGYEEAYTEAVAFLRSVGRIKDQVKGAAL